MTEIISFLGVGFCIPQKDKSLCCFCCLLFGKENSNSQSKEDFGNGRKVKRYLNIRQVNLSSIVIEGARILFLFLNVY